MGGQKVLNGRTRETLRVHTQIWIFNLHLNENYRLSDCNCKFREMFFLNACANLKINATWFDIVILV